MGEGSLYSGQRFTESLTGGTVLTAQAHARSRNARLRVQRQKSRAPRGTGFLYNWRRHKYVVRLRHGRGLFGGRHCAKTRMHATQHITGGEEHE